MFPLTPVAEPTPRVAPDASVKLPAPETVLVPQFKVPLITAVFPDDITIPCESVTVFEALTVNPFANVMAFPDIAVVPSKTIDLPEEGKVTVPLLNMSPVKV